MSSLISVIKSQMHFMHTGILVQRLQGKQRKAKSDEKQNSEVEKCSGPPDVHYDGKLDWQWLRTV